MADAKTSVSKEEDALIKKRLLTQTTTARQGADPPLKRLVKKYLAFCGSLSGEGAHAGRHPRESGGSFSESVRRTDDDLSDSVVRREGRRGAYRGAEGPRRRRRTGVCERERRGELGRTDRGGDVRASRSARA